MIGVLVGAATGVASGIMVAFFRMPAFVATLAMMSIARGLVKTLLARRLDSGPVGQPQRIRRFSQLRARSRRPHADHHVSHSTCRRVVRPHLHPIWPLRLRGRGNERGARVSGVPVKWVTFSVFRSSAAPTRACQGWS